MSSTTLKKNQEENDMEEEEEEEEEEKGYKDALSFKPNLDDFMNDEDDEDNQFHNANSDMVGGEDKFVKKSLKNEKKILEKNKHLLKELRDEFSENPIEMKEDEEDDGNTKDGKLEKEKRIYEEENYVRLVETREEKIRKNKKLNRARQGVGVDEILDGFDDEVKAVNSLLKTNKKNVFASLRNEEEEEEEAYSNNKRKDGINKYVNEFEQGRKSIKEAKVFGGDDEVGYTNKNNNNKTRVDLKEEEKNFPFPKQQQQKKVIQYMIITPNQKKRTLQIKANRTNFQPNTHLK